MNRQLRGIALPFRIADGRVAVADGERKAADDVRHLLETRIGERLLRRGYGSGLHQALHEADDLAGRALLRHDLERALRTHLPQLRLAGPVEVTHESEGTLRIDLTYRLDPVDIVRSLSVVLGAPDAAGALGRGSNPFGNPVAGGVGTQGAADAARSSP